MEKYLLKGENNMIKILVMCMQGMSTAIMEQKIQKSAEDKGIDLSIKAIAVNQFKGAVGYDIIVLGPQVKYAENNIRKKLDENEESKNIPLYVIEPQDFAMMRGEAVLDKIMGVLNNGK